MFLSSEETTISTSKFEFILFWLQAPLQEYIEKGFINFFKNSYLKLL